VYSSPSPNVDTRTFVDPDLFTQDLNDLHSDIFCTDKEGKRAFIHFVEIFTSDPATGVNTDTTNWIISFVPSAPFRVVNTENAVYSRRPDCSTSRTFCGHYQRVTNCTVNSVELATIMNKHNNFITDAFVISKDRIYINMKDNEPSLCSNTGFCCDYIMPSTDILFPAPGYCPYAATQVIMDFIDDVEDHSTIYDFLQEEDLVDEKHGLKKAHKKPHKKPHKKVSHKKPVHKKTGKKTLHKEHKEEENRAQPLEGTQPVPKTEDVDPESITTPDQDKIFEVNFQKMGNGYKDKNGIHKINHIGGKKDQTTAENETRAVDPVPVKAEDTVPLLTLKKK